MQREQAKIIRDRRANKDNTEADLKRVRETIAEKERQKFTQPAETKTQAKVRQPEGSPRIKRAETASTQKPPPGLVPGSWAAVASKPKIVNPMQRLSMQRLPVQQSTANIGQEARDPEPPAQQWKEGSARDRRRERRGKGSKYLQRGQP